MIRTAVDDASIENVEQIEKFDWDNELYVLMNDYECTNIKNISYMLKHRGITMHNRLH